LKQLLAIVSPLFVARLFAYCKSFKVTFCNLLQISAIGPVNLGLSSTKGNRAVVSSSIALGSTAAFSEGELTTGVNSVALGSTATFSEGRLTTGVNSVAVTKA